MFPNRTLRNDAEYLVSQVLLRARGKGNAIPRGIGEMHSFVVDNNNLIKKHALRIDTGVGNHSYDGPVMRPAIRKLLKKSKRKRKAKRKLLVDEIHGIFYVAYNH